MSDCLFCKIVSGEIPSEKVYESDSVYAFRDISPQAPTHILVIPKEHIASADVLTAANTDVISTLHTAIPVIAKREGIASDGYRVVTNIGTYGQQTVPHLHYHILGGRQLKWPPG